MLLYSPLASRCFQIIGRPLALALADTIAVVQASARTGSISAITTHASVAQLLRTPSSVCKNPHFAYKPLKNPPLVCKNVLFAYIFQPEKDILRRRQRARPRPKKGLGTCIACSYTRWRCFPAGKVRWRCQEKRMLRQAPFFRGGRSPFVFPKGTSRPCRCSGRLKGPCLRRRKELSSRPKGAFRPCYLRIL